ncbi:MAG: M20 family metallopeptidase [Actinomycetota bacterium]|nr:M20 family metallopeptidase [Actinomycetota bacterium]
MSLIDEDLLDTARALLPGVVDLRRALHRHPELGLELPRTQAAVLDALDGLGLEISVGERLSSVVADLRGARPGPTVLLRGDMDALPMPEDSGVEFASTVENTMHACGHDAHTAMLVGAARLLADRRDDLAGNVRFMFQPGEEGSGGAALMIDEGVLDGVDAAFAIHIAPNVPSGIVAWRPGAAMASADELTITVTGRGGHASSPHWALDPVPVACELVLALQSMITRTVDVFDPAVLTIAQIAAGTVNNVIPESVTMHGTLRAVSERTRHAVWERIRTVADGVAAAHGAAVEVVIQQGYPVTVNDARFAAFAASVVDDRIGPGRSFQLPNPVMGAEDFSYVLDRVQGAMVFLGVCPPDHPNPFDAPSCHSNRMVLHEDNMADGVALHAAIATTYLERAGEIG